MHFKNCSRNQSLKQTSTGPATQFPWQLIVKERGRAEQGEGEKQRGREEESMGQGEQENLSGKRGFQNRMTNC